MRAFIAFLINSFLIGLAFGGEAPEKCDYVFGIGRFAQPNPYQEIVNPTINVVKKLFPDKNICIRSLKTQDLQQALENAELDFFISSSGMYRRMLHIGIRDIAAVEGRNAINPNYAEGSLFVANADKYKGDGFYQFKGKALAAGIPSGFTGYLAGIHELKKNNIDPESFFSSIEFVGPNQYEILERILNGTSDLGILRTCMLESYLTKHPESGNKFRVINEQSHKNFVCKHSTELYPSWIFGVSKQTDVQTATLLTTALLKMNETESGYSWGIATDFSFVDKLLKDLQIGPFKQSDFWYIQQFWSRYKKNIGFGFIILLLICMHSWRSDRLVKKKTRELEAAHAYETKLRTERNNAREKILNMQRIGVIGQFSSLLIHELGQPSAANLLLIHGFRRYIETNEPTKENVDGILTKLLDNLNREEKLIEKIRKYTKSRTHNRKRVDLCSCLRSSIHIIDKTLPENIKLTFSLPNESIYIQADELDLEILFINLIKNSSEAISAVQDPTISITLKTSNDAATISIIDNGPRLTDEEINKIKIPLSSTKSNGLGLGVYICQMIAEGLNGTLEYSRHTEDYGIETQVTFPL